MFVIVNFSKKSLIDDILEEDGLLDKETNISNDNSDDVADAVLSLADIALSLIDKGKIGTSVSRNLYSNSVKKASKDAKKEAVKDTVSEIGKQTLKKKAGEVARNNSKNIIKDTLKGNKEIKNTNSDLSKNIDTNKAQSNLKLNTLPKNDAQIKHIFGNRKGHLPETVDNKKLLESIANDKSAYKGTDKYGNEWYIKLDSKGRQIWVRVRKGVINEGGRNDIPLNWDSETGLNYNPFKKK